jgi:molybdopterin converting factor small subunit
MVQVVFTPNLQRHVSCPAVGVTGSTVAEALSSVFDDNPTLRRYVLDDQGALRKNMVIFVDGRALKDRRTLNDRVADNAEIFVMQALTGG